MSQHAFDWASEHLERILSTWWGAVLYCVGIALCAWRWGWDGLDRAIYVTGAVIIVLLIGSGRRDSKAAHAKLDKLTPDHVLDRAEERAEKEIEELRS